MASDLRAAFEDLRARATAMWRTATKTDLRLTDTDRESRASGLPQMGDTWSYYSDRVRLENERKAKYRDYEQMDVESAEASSALDIYADNAVMDETSMQAALKVVSEDGRVQSILEEMVERTQMRGALWAIARDLAKYGDEFEEAVLDRSLRIQRFKALHPKTIVRQHDRYGRLDPKEAFVQYDNVTQKVVATFRDWQVIHFHLARSRSVIYGVDGAILAPVRRVYKQLQMLEDGMVIARLTRAPNRYAYLVDTTGISPGEPTREYMEKVRVDLRRRRAIDPVTGKMDLRYNPLSAEEDIFIGVRKDGGKADVKVLEGQSNLGRIEDVEYFLNKYFAGIKVPKAYMGFERDVNSKSTLQYQDIQFARSVRRIQTALIRGLRQAADLELALHGVVLAEARYALTLPLISAIDELHRLRIQRIRVEIAQVLKNDMNVSVRFILQELLGYTEKQMESILKDWTDAESFDNKVAQKVLALAPPAKKEPVPVGREPSRREAAEIKDRLGEFMESLSELKELVDWKLESEDPITNQTKTFPPNGFVQAAVGSPQD